MTNHIDPDQIRKAKEWAEYVTRPAVVIATGDQVRAAREALEEQA